MIVKFGHDSLSVKQRCPNARIEDLFATFHAAVILYEGEYRIQSHTIGQTNISLYLNNKKL